MKGIFGIVGLLLALAIVGVLVKQQLFSAPQNRPALQQGTLAPPDGTSSAPLGETVKQQAQQVQQQVKQALDAAMQQARPMPDEK